MGSDAGKRQTQKTAEVYHGKGGDSQSKDDRFRTKLRSHEPRGRDKQGTEDQRQPSVLSETALVLPVILGS